jgi:hypothetical protein
MGAEKENKDELPEEDAIIRIRYIMEYFIPCDIRHLVKISAK